MRTVIIATLGMALAACGDAQSVESTQKTSPFGPDDRLGAMNHLSPAKTADAAKLITTGKTYSLGMVTGRDTPAYGPRAYDVVVLQLSDGMGVPIGSNKASGNDDIVRTYVGIGSQIDGLGHMGTDHVYYNGVPASDFVTTAGLTQFGTHNLPPVATRGILLDMTQQFGDPVPDGTAFNKAEIDAAAEAVDVTIEQGDIVLFHTGKMKATEGDPNLAPTAPGLGKEGAAYLASLGVVAIGADTWALEVIPFENETELFPVHPILLAENGVYILENMVTDELAADGIAEFFFSLGVPKLEGTVQAIINPVGIR